MQNVIMITTLYILFPEYFLSLMATTVSMVIDDTPRSSPIVTSLSSSLSVAKSNNKPVTAIVVVIAVVIVLIIVVLVVMLLLFYGKKKAKRAKNRKKHRRDEKNATDTEGAEGVSFIDVSTTNIPPGGKNKKRQKESDLEVEIPLQTFHKSKGNEYTASVNDGKTHGESSFLSSAGRNNVENNGEGIEALQQPPQSTSREKHTRPTQETNSESRLNSVHNKVISLSSKTIGDSKNKMDGHLTGAKQSESTNIDKLQQGDYINTRKETNGSQIQSNNKTSYKNSEALYNEIETDGLDDVQVSDIQNTGENVILDRDVRKKEQKTATVKESNSKRYPGRYYYNIS